jgi:hypothetical protein
MPGCTGVCWMSFYTPKAKPAPVRSVNQGESYNGSWRSRVEYKAILRYEASRLIAIFSVTRSPYTCNSKALTFHDHNHVWYWHHIMYDMYLDMRPIRNIYQPSWSHAKRGPPRSFQVGHITLSLAPMYLCSFTLPLCYRRATPQSDVLITHRTRSAWCWSVNIHPISFRSEYIQWE